MKAPGILTILSITIFGSLAVSATAAPVYQSHYTGQEKRSIKTLSKEDVEQLSKGKGWGLAKAAELNGVPGPAHLLEMKNEIALSALQVEKIEAVFKDMQQKAIKLGGQLISLETELNQAFARNAIDPAGLKQRLSAIEAVRSELRYVHLAAHLETPKIVSAEQIRKYNQLRGYSNSDPCSNIPAGHDKAMWLKHNNCK